MTASRSGTTRRIIIDGSMARGGGGFTYLVNIIPVLAQLAPRHRFLLLTGSERIEQSLPSFPNLEVRRHTAEGLGGRVRSLLIDGPRLATDWDADLYYSVAEYAPLRAPCPVVAAFRNRAVFTPIEGGWSLKQTLRLRIIRALSWASSRASSRIVFVSRDSADYIGDSLSIPKRKRRVVHHGINRSLFADPSPAPGNLDRYVLSVSSIYRYKNFISLIEGWAALRDRNPNTPDLVIIGDDQDPEYSAQMRTAREATGSLAEHIHILGEVPHAEVIAWYQNAELFVFPSYLETFGHPLLEAMTSGLPIVAADIPVFREIAEDAALYAEPTDARAFADRMEQALFDQAGRNELLAAGARRIEDFSWQQSAEKLLAVFEDAISAGR